jgi:hypothetical protein
MDAYKDNMWVDMQGIANEAVVYGAQDQYLVSEPKLSTITRSTQLLKIS